MPRRKCIGQIYFLVVFRQYYRSTALRGKSGQSREPRKNLEPKDQRGWRSPAPEWGMSLRYFFQSVNYSTLLDGSLNYFAVRGRRPSMREHRKIELITMKGQ